MKLDQNIIKAIKALPEDRVIDGIQLMESGGMIYCAHPDHKVIAFDGKDWSEPEIRESLYTKAHNFMGSEEYVETVRQLYGAATGAKSASVDVGFMKVSVIFKPGILGSLMLRASCRLAGEQFEYTEVPGGDFGALSIKRFMDNALMARIRAIEKIKLELQ